MDMLATLRQYEEYLRWRETEEGQRRIRELAREQAAQEEAFHRLIAENLRESLVSPQTPT